MRTILGITLLAAGVIAIIASFAVEITANYLGYIVFWPGAAIAAVGLTVWRGHWLTEFFDRFL